MTQSGPLILRFSEWLRRGGLQSLAQPRADGVVAPTGSLPAPEPLVLAHVLTAGAAVVPLAQRRENGHARPRLR
jgi:hypothetical protein